MGAHDLLVADVSLQCERLLTRTDELKTYLASVASLVVQDRTKWSFLGREARSSAIVCTMAELEALTQFLIKKTHEALNSATLSYRELRKCLRQLAAHDAFESLRALQDHEKLWNMRSFATTLEGCGELFKLPLPRKGPQPPLDGGTLKPSHFNRLWAIYGLPDIAFPDPSWAASLQKLAGLRNEIAHGTSSFADIFSQAGATIPEIERYIDDVSSFSIHLIENWTLYLADELYLEVNAP